MQLCAQTGRHQWEQWEEWEGRQSPREQRLLRNSNSGGFFLGLVLRLSYQLVSSEGEMDPIAFPRSPEQGAWVGLVSPS